MAKWVSLLAFFLIVNMTGKSFAATRQISVEGRTVTVTDDPFDLGYQFGRSWLDINRDGKADEYCRVGGDAPNHKVLECSFFVDSAQQTNTGSLIPDWGYDAGRNWLDGNGDSLIDYCRVVGNPPFPKCECIAGNGDGAGHGNGTFGPTTFVVDSGKCPVPGFLTQVTCSVVKRCFPVGIFQGEAQYDHRCRNECNNGTSSQWQSCPGACF
jgi:hypothetical protein